MKKIVILDDLDGSLDAQTVHIGLDGRNYEIDLNEVNRRRLFQELAPYVGAARRKPGGNRR